MEIGTVELIDIQDEMRVSYLDYAMSVIVARALPDVRDGLKPVHRRILYAMHDMGLRANTPFKKSARIVGEVLGKYHPHGDQAVYEAMARMAQDFSMRYLLVDGQGNFGSIDGDSPAAMRYTEARLTHLAEEMLADIDMDTVDFVENFDGSLKEPAVLPARLPNLLLNGASGIAVGMATNIPPHNLREVVAAASYMIDHYDRRDEITVDDLMRFVSGPDFPTGGIIVGTEEIKNAYATGRGRVVVRAVTHIEDMGNGRHRIVVTQIPYQISKTTIVERIAEQVRNGRLDMIADLRDESDRRGLSIVVELKRGAQPRKVLNQLLKYTPLQSTFGVQLLALVDGEPRMLSLKRVLIYYIEHRRAVVHRRTAFELARRRDRAHVLEGLLKALANLDDVIQTIRRSKDADDARTNLMQRFDLTERQAQAILEMQLRRLAALERQQIEDEHKQVRERIAYLEDLLASPKKILALIKADLNELAAKYGDDRRTQIAPDAEADFDETDLVADEEVLIAITQHGYIKRTPADAYRVQNRGGKGVAGMTTKEEDAVWQLFAAGSLERVLFFSDRGKAYQEHAYQIPDSGRTGKGVLLASILSLEHDEKITAAVPVPSPGEGYLTMVTRRGRIKRVGLAEFASVRPSGIIAMPLDEGDALGWVKFTRGDREIILVTAQGQGLRFSETQVRPMGRSASGVNAIRLRAGDGVAGVAVVENPDADLLVITARGYGKRTPLREYPQHSRAGGGVKAIKVSARTGPVIAARTVTEADDVTLITTGGIMLRTPAKDISRQSRSARGTPVMKMKNGGDVIASIATVENRQARRANGQRDGAGAGAPVDDEIAPPGDNGVDDVE